MGNHLRRCRATATPLVLRQVTDPAFRARPTPRPTAIATRWCGWGYSGNVYRLFIRSFDQFDQQLRIEDMAQELGMSTSSFHQHFKAVTALSPLQFQKQLRLQEARRLMLGEQLDAASAGFQVGYDDASHFNREYKRLFGLPPMRDVERLRETPMQNVALAVD